MKVPAAVTTKKSVVRANLSLNLCHRDFYETEGKSISPDVSFNNSLSDLTLGPTVPG
jgi:hypothetical protein